MPTQWEGLTEETVTGIAVAFTRPPATAQSTRRPNGPPLPRTCKHSRLSDQRRSVRLPSRGSFYGEYLASMATVAESLGGPLTAISLTHLAPDWGEARSLRERIHVSPGDPS